MFKKQLAQQTFLDLTIQMVEKMPMEQKKKKKELLNKLILLLFVLLINGTCISQDYSFYKGQIELTFSKNDLKKVYSDSVVATTIHELKESIANCPEEYDCKIIVTIINNEVSSKELGLMFNKSYLIENEYQKKYGEHVFFYQIIDKENNNLDFIKNQYYIFISTRIFNF